ncbi:MAG: hypothetical protein WBK54_03075 [Bacilli bacterium]|jgi:hypothetical protein|nr:hypothetical protein [Acholeplasmataceae bacterium]
MILATPLEYILSAALFLSFLIIFVFALTFYRLASGKTFETTKEESETVVPTERTVLQPKAAFSLADITDEDMMVAALVAAIDYAEETKKDVRLLSIREIQGGSNENL